MRFWELDEHLVHKGFLLSDITIGTNLFMLGLETSYSLELWNVGRSHVIIRFQTSVHDSGSALLLTISFGSNALCLKIHEVQDRVTTLNTAACLAWTQEVAADR